MNKKLFLAGVALLAAVGFTSCNSDTPIDSSNPSGVTPTTARHQVGGDYYDWTAIVKNLQELKDFWKDDQTAVANLLKEKKSDKANILIEVAGYELKAGDVITLPNFWGVDPNGKVVNITFEGNFKNADFERASQSAGGSKQPVTINANTLKGAEVNFTFDVEKFDLILDTREARSTLSGNYTIGYMKANADKTKTDAVEIKEGTVEGLDVTSTGNYKGTIDGVWTIGGSLVNACSADGIKLVDQRIKAKNVYVEDNPIISTDYTAGGKDVSYALGTVKFVKAGLVDLDNTKDVTPSIEKIQGFDKSKCKVRLDGLNYLENIGAIEKVTIDQFILGQTVVKKDIFTDVTFDDDVIFSTKDVDTIENVTFNGLEIVIPEDGKTITFNGVNFWQKVKMTSDIKVTETTKTEIYTYQWIIDNTKTGAGHFEQYGGNTDKSLLETNKTKEVKKYSYDAIKYDDVPGSTTYQKFIKSAASTADAVLNEANSSYVVEITRTWTKGQTYIPEDVDIVLDDKCKFFDANVTGTGAALSSTNYALNCVWGFNQLWDEMCWYNVNYAGSDYVWKKTIDDKKNPYSPSLSGVFFTLTKAAE